MWAAVAPRGRSGAISSADLQVPRKVRLGRGWVLLLLVDSVASPPVAEGHVR